jgi:hypothetical protein
MDENDKLGITMHSKNSSRCNISARSNIYDTPICMTGFGIRKNGALLDQHETPPPGNSAPLHQPAIPA